VVEGGAGGRTALRVAWLNGSPSILC
jgi:hypothetical protein